MADDVCNRMGVREVLYNGCYNVILLCVSIRLLLEGSFFVMKSLIGLGRLG